MEFNDLNQVQIVRRYNPFINVIYFIKFILIILMTGCRDDLRPIVYLFIA